MSPWALHDAAISTPQITLAASGGQSLLRLHHCNGNAYMSTQALAAIAGCCLFVLPGECHARVITACAPPILLVPPGVVWAGRHAQEGHRLRSGGQAASHVGTDACTLVGRLLPL